MIQMLILIQTIKDHNLMNKCMMKMLKNEFYVINRSFVHKNRISFEKKIIMKHNGTTKNDRNSVDL